MRGLGNIKNRLSIMLKRFYLFLKYRDIQIDSQHTIKVPRFGWKQKDIDATEKRAKELNESINWE